MCENAQEIVLSNRFGGFELVIYGKNWYNLELREHELQSREDVIFMRTIRCAMKCEAEHEADKL